MPEGDISKILKQLKEAALDMFTRGTIGEVTNSKNRAFLTKLK